MGRFHESLLQWKSNNYDVFVCVCALVSVGARVYVRMGARACRYVHGCVRV